MEYVLCRVLYGRLYTFYGALLLICRARPICIVIVNRKSIIYNAPKNTPA
jgi:hypothetical protein